LSIDELRLAFSVCSSALQAPQVPPGSVLWCRLAMSDDDPLRRLAERGRNLLDEDRVANAKLTSEADKAAVEHQRQLRASISWFCRWGWWLGGAGFGALLAVGTYAVLPASWKVGQLDEGSAASAIAMLVVTLGPLAFFFLRPWIGDRAVARERRWLSTVPFALPGYFESIGNSTTEGEVALTIHFQTVTHASAPDSPFRSGVATSRSTAPTADLLHAVFRTIDASVDTSWSAPRILHRISFGENSVLSNVHLVRWLHRAIDVLLALHAQHAIDRVTIDFG
jgi:hypothetical protein